MFKLKVYIKIFWCIQILLGIWVSNGYARENISSVDVFINPAVYYAVPAEEFSVDIVVGPVQDFMTFTTDFYFDPKVIEITNITEGTFLNAGGVVETKFLMNIDNANGKCILAISRLTSPSSGISSTGNNTILTIHLKSKVEGATNIQLLNTGLIKSDGVSTISSIVAGSTIKVIPKKTANIYYSSSVVNVDQLETFSLDLILVPVTDVMTFTTEITFDPSVVTIMNATEGRFLNEDGTVQTAFLKNIDNASGKCNLAITRMTSPASGISSITNNTVLSIQFKANNFGKSELTLNNTGLILPDGVSEYNVSTSSAEVNVNFKAGYSTVSFNPTGITVLSGENFESSVQVANVSNLFGVSFDIYYNPDIVNITSISEGSFLSEGGQTKTIFQKDIDNDNGKAVIGISRINSTKGVETVNPEELFKVQFLAINSGSGNIYLANSGLLAPDGNTTYPVLTEKLKINVKSDKALIKGKITNSETGLPIQGVIVKTLNYESKPSDVQGNYELKVAFGYGYELTVISDFYEPISIPNIDVPESAPEKNVDIQLVPKKNQPPVIISITEDLFIEENNNAIFLIEVNGDNINYQWYKDGNMISNDAYFQGANSNQLSISSVNSNHEGQYYCEVSNNFGSVVSNSINFTVGVKVEVPSTFNGFPDIYNEFTLFGTMYRVRHYLTSIPLLKNTDKEITTVIPIITYIPNQNKPDEEYAINDKYKLGLLLNYAYYKYGFCDTRLKSNLNDSYWNKQAEIMIELGDVFKPWKATVINGSFALSQVLTSIGLTWLIPQSSYSQFKNVYTVLKYTKTILKMGVEAFQFLENISSRPDDNSMSQVMSAQTNINNEFYEKYSNDPKHHEYMIRGFKFGESYIELINASVSAYEGYLKWLKADGYFQEYMLSPNTEFGQMALRNSNDILDKALIDAGAAAGVTIGGMLYQQLMYKGIDEIGAIATDLVYMGNIHAGTLEAYSYILDERKKDLDNLLNFSNLAELDSAVSLYRYTSGKYFEVLSAFTQNFHTISEAIHNCGLSGRIAVSNNDLESCKSVMIQNGDVHSGIINDIIEFQSATEFIYQNYPKFKSSTISKKARIRQPNSVQSLNIGVEKVYIDHIGFYFPNDTVNINCEITNFGSYIENDIIVNVYDNDELMSSVEVDSIKFLEIKKLSYLYIAKEGEREIKFKIQNSGNEADVSEKSIFLFIKEMPSLTNPLVDSLELGYKFSVQYNSQYNTPPDSSCVYLFLNNKIFKLFTTDNDFTDGSKFISDLIEINKNTSFYFSVLVDGNWYRYPKIGEFELIVDTTAVNQPSFDLIYPDLNDSIDLDKIEFIWTALVPSFQYQNITYNLYYSDNPIFQNSVVIKNISDTSVYVSEILNPSQKYYWYVEAINNTDTIKSLSINMFIMKESGIETANDLKTFDKDILIYPNPFNDKITFKYYLDEADEVVLDIITLTGHKIKTKMIGFQGTGTNICEVDLKELASGIYIYDLRIGAKFYTGCLIKNE